MKKCSQKKHENIDAISYCQECRIYMCNKCENLHIELFQDHHQYKLEKDVLDLFTGLCKIENHSIKLEYFCKDHNQLCCLACISKIKEQNNGQHSECEICLLKDIKEEKKVKLDENIKYLDNISKPLEDLINQLKSLFEKINKNKEELKIKIQKIFTKIRNEINVREDEILLQVDKKYEDLYFKEDIVKESEKLPKKVKLSLDNGRQINKEWNDDNKLNLFINDCINIEKNIDYISAMVDIIEDNKKIDIEIVFIPGESELNSFLDKIKSFGDLKCNKNEDIINKSKKIIKELTKKEKKLKNELEKINKNKIEANERLKIEEYKYITIMNELKENEIYINKEEEKIERVMEIKQIEEMNREEEKVKLSIEPKKKKRKTIW